VLIDYLHILFELILAKDFKDGIQKMKDDSNQIMFWSVANINLKLDFHENVALFSLSKF
jgi:hypothetical protein